MIVQDLRSRLDRRQTASIVEFLQEDFPKYSVGLFAEHGAENHSHSVVGGNDIDGLFLAVSARVEIRLAF